MTQDDMLNYPTSSREETVESIRKAASDQALNPEVKEALRERANLWGVPYAFSNAFREPGRIFDQRGPVERKFALEIRSEDGVLVERRYCTIDPTAAANDFYREFRGIPASYRKRAAEALLEAGETEGSWLYVLARQGAASQRGIKRAAEARLEVYKDSTSRKIAAEVAASKENDFNPSVVVSVFDLLDRREGLTKNYGKSGFDVPEAYIYGKVATEDGEESQAGTIKLTNGKSVTTDEICALTKDQVGALGDDILSDVLDGDVIDCTKLLTLVPTLPAPDADVLCAVLNKE